MKKIWIDPGHGGSASGALGCGRMEKDDNLTYALELARQFEAQGLTVVLTRTEDVDMDLDSRTNIENRAKCSLAISCHRNGAAAAANGFEVWLHSKAPDSYITWARDIAEGIKATGMALRMGQVGAGVYRGYPGYPNDNFYASSGTNSPSCLLELGFMGSERDNALFDARYKDMCAAIVKASCKFLGIKYTVKDAPEDKPPEDKPAPPTQCAHCAALQEQVASLTTDKAALQGKYDVLRGCVERFVESLNGG